MKRDMELCRTILLEIEGEKAISKTIGYPEGDVAYHFRILEEGGLIKRQKGKDYEVTFQFEGRLIPCGSYVLTWDGHDFLDASRNGTFFKKALKELRDKGVDVTFNILLQYLQAKAKAKLGIG